MLFITAMLGVRF